MSDGGGRRKNVCAAISNQETDDELFLRAVRGISGEYNAFRDFCF